MNVKNYKKGEGEPGGGRGKKIDARDTKRDGVPGS